MIHLIMFHGRRKGMFVNLRSILLVESPECRTHADSNGHSI
jgi:hypothetical protein